MLLADRKDCFTRRFHLPVSEPGDCFTPELIHFSSTLIRHLLLVGRLLLFIPTPSREYLDLTHCDCPLLLKRNCTFPSTVFSTYTMEDMAAGPRRSAALLLSLAEKKYSQESYGFASHSQLLRKYQCATSIVLCADNPFTRANKQDGNSNDDPIFSPTHFHPVK